MTPVEQARAVIISADWLNACGYRDDAKGDAESRTFAVVRTMPNTLPDGSRMFVIDFHGRHWTVAEWRCDWVRPVALDAFTTAYITAALWSSTDDNGEPLDYGRDWTDLAPETLRAMTEDCAKFQRWHAGLITDEYRKNDRSGFGFSVEESAGHDFWLTRAGHGCGFWDGDWKQPAGDVLTHASQLFGNVDLYVGDDGLIYQG